MSDNNITKNIIAGEYRHFKGKNYLVYCIAKDSAAQEFVLYQECNNKEKFWIGPREMFFEKVIIDNRTVDRFKYINSKKQISDCGINSLLKKFISEPFTIRHSETCEEYFIADINEDRDYIIIDCKNNNGSGGYLSGYELLDRMGYTGYIINNKLNLISKEATLPSSLQLKIGENAESLIKDLINPCSIDLKIAEAGYLKTKRKTIDLQSIEYISRANQLWKRVKVHDSKNQRSVFFKIHPGETILTHTKEKLKIPSDCAGKIEIKSTYARLSLSISFGDFCNPGYEGYFPLEITNHGKHTIVLHPGETMAQLMLLKLNGTTLVHYTNEATYKDKNGYDEGTPYAFWRERSIIQLRKQKGTENIIKAYYKISEEISKNGTADINAFKNRFDNTFLAFCQKHINKTKYRHQDTELPDTIKIINQYAKREALLSKLCNIKWAPGLFDILVSVITFVLQDNKIINISFAKLLAYLALPALIILAITIVLWLKCPKYFCTLENIDISKLV